MFLYHVMIEVRNDMSLRWDVMETAYDTRLRRSRLRWWQLTGAFGVLWLVLFVAGGIILQGEPPAYDQPIEATRALFTGDSRYLLGDYIAGIAFVLCFMPYTVGLHRVLASAEAEPRIGSMLFLVGGIATVVIGDVATAFLDAVAIGQGASELPDAAIRAFLRADAVAIAAIGLPMALTLFSAATVIWRTGVLWRWLGVLAVGAGILNVIGGSFILADSGNGPLFFIRFAGLIGFGLFVLFSSLDLMIRPAHQSLAVQRE